MQPELNSILMLMLLGFVNPVTGNDSLDAIPQNSILVIQIEDPQQFGKTLKDLFDPLVDDKVRHLSVSEPFRLHEDKEWKSFVRLATNAINDFRAIQRLTFFLHSTEPNLEYGIIIDCKQNEIDGIRKLVKQLRVLQHRFEFGDAKKQSKFESSLANLLAGMATIKLNWVNNKCLISNSETVLANIAERLIRPQKSKIQNDRRFARAITHVEKDRQRTGFVYFKPLEFMHLLYPTLHEKDFRKYGLNEVVSGGVSFRLSDDLDDTTKPVIAIQSYFPVTLPLAGETLNWSLFEPIESIPNISVSADWDRFALEMSNKNHLKYVDSFGAMYDSIHGKGAYRDKLDKDWKRFGGFQNYRESRSGDTGRFWFRTADNQYHLLSFDGVRDRTAMEDSIDQFTSQSKKFPYQKTRIRGHDAWFHSELIAKRLSKANDGGDPRSIVHNRGWLLSDKWLIQGEKDHIEEYLSAVGKQRSVSQLSKQIFRGGDKVFSNNSQPAYVYLRWLNGSFVHEIRKDYLTQKYGPKAASQIAYKIRMGKLEHVPVNSRTDRAYAIVERLLFNWCENFGRDATTFEFKDSFVDFRYFSFPVSK